MSTLCSGELKSAQFSHLRGTNILVNHVIQLTGTIFELNSHIKETNVLTKFHANWAKNVTSSKNAPPTGGHVFSPIWTIFELIRDINKTKETHFLTKFHQNWAKNVTCTVFTCLHYIHIEKNAPPTGGHVFSPIWTIFELVRDINKSNVLTNFHDDWAKIVTSRVFTSKSAPPTGGHVFSPTWTIFKLVRDINKTNVLTNFHDDWTKILTSRVFTSHVIQRTGTIFELNSHFKETNVLTKFHANWAKNVTSRVFTCFHYIHLENNAPPTGGHVFSPFWTIFELVRDINKTNVLTNFHDDWAKIVTYRENCPPPGCHVIQRTGTIFKLNSHIKDQKVFTCFHYIHKEKNAPPTDGHVFSPIWTIFELVRDINKTNVLTNFYDHWAKIVTSRPNKENCPPPPGSHETNVLTKFHENWAKNVTSRKNAPPTGGHVFSPIWTIFELVRDINKTNIFTNFHDDWAKFVTSRENCPAHWRPCFSKNQNHF
ncbi:hypothetical protein DPMN_151131 [Dreissena polymorpha]|uniref:Uncharacterized protein n=1 Tax=Dreissena polymorpha TaxID=45954 RepID=A0A9D4FHT2_DREPO|nr:hypothetical protein DPMN_151131 [Dreissena polymorpha]